MRRNFGAKAWAYPQPVYMIGSYYDETEILTGEIINVSADDPNTGILNSYELLKN